MDDIKIIKRDLKTMLSESRYQHSINVAEECRKLAKVYLFDEDKAYLAGLTHDLAKELSNEEIKQIMVQYKLPESSFSEENIKTSHADIGAIIAREKYNLDSSICQAIKSHTLGNIPMTILEKIVFIADKIEPKRNYQDIEKIRTLAYIDIDAAIIMYIENNLKNLTIKGKKINTKTIEVLNYLKSIPKNK